MRLVALALVGGLMSAPGTRVASAGQAPPTKSLAPAAEQASAVTPGLESAYWRLTHLGEKETAFPGNAREPHLVFNPGGSVTGADGCNTFRGGYTVREDTLSFGPLMGTLMACPNLPDKLDSRFKQALGNTRKWTVSATELTLLGDKDTVLARFEAVPR